MIQSYSLHKVTNQQEFGFSPADYSRFKFGDDSIAKKFGNDLARGFIENFRVVLSRGEQLVVIPSPYSFIPTATFAMKNYFTYALNNWLAENGHPVVQETKVHRTVTYKEDYGELNAEERIKLIGNDSFHIDREFVKGKTLVFLDDIRITGSHEKMILKMAGEYGLENESYLLYFAELHNKNIHPNIENYLNYYAVKSIFDVEKIVGGGNFKFNTRVVKYILSTELPAFTIFLQNQSDDFLEQLYHLAIGNGYHTIPAYAVNLNFIKEHIFANTLNKIDNGN